MNVVVWVGLLLLLAIEIIGALTHQPWFAAIAAPLMIALVAFGYMRLRAETPLSRIFAITGLFWLAIMLSLGNLDFAVRRNALVPQTTSSANYK
jgi:cytochrome c oxidase subunit 4